ncbi:DUF3397 domain-containing protein [Radiobacillus deserti]|uniref:DUF3397 domain-containing protein n=1 Tax=Radiobacillus deserti TaxID=2594883 RepID=A0A516KFB4_9BACI|nr:DUF3397 domain-containing protein [Radiobacillus deserti]QDP40083.1 DUF3397 domain-containing protein [Radiobacillus deserti]
MVEILSRFIGFMLTFPFLISLIVFYVSYSFSKKKWKSIHRMVHYTAILYIMAVMVLLQDLLGFSVVGFILITLLVLLSVFVILERNMHGEVIFLRAWKLFWRCSFLIFFFLYIILVFIGILSRIFSF